MIELREVSVRYPRTDRPALDHVSLIARRGDITAIVGPNGSGKSTLVRALLGRVPLTHGEILVNGEAVNAQSRREVATRVAAVTQREESLFPLTVRDYVALGRYPHLGMWRAVSAVDRAAIERALALTETTGFIERTLHELSGGEWQRVRLARALAQGGEAIVLDEPTTFLDVGHEMAIFELLGNLTREGQAVLLVSHQLNLVARFAAHMVLLHEGRVTAHGTPDDVMQGSILERVYQWPLVVTRDPAIGSPALVPLRVSTRGTTPRN
jgi:iron complex transport system ATP-binding protein